MYLQKSASIQRRTSPVKFARSLAVRRQPSASDRTTKSFFGSSPRASACWTTKTRRARSDWLPSSGSPRMRSSKFSLCQPMLPSLRWHKMCSSPNHQDRQNLQDVIFRQLVLGCVKKTLVTKETLFSICMLYTNVLLSFLSFKNLRFVRRFSVQYCQYSSFSSN